MRSQGTAIIAVGASLSRNKATVAAGSGRTEAALARK